MSGKHQIRSDRSACSRVALVLVAWLWGAVPADAQTAFSWNTGSGTWNNTAANWDPLGPPAAGDDALLGDLSVAAAAAVSLGLTTPALNLLEISGGVDLLTNGFGGEAVTVEMRGAASRLIVQDGGMFDNSDGATAISNGSLLLIEDGGEYSGGDVTLSSGGDVQLTGGELVIRANSGTGFLDINSNSELFGWGTVDFRDSGVINDDLLVNDGVIRTSRPFLDPAFARHELILDTTFGSKDTEPLVDLDGANDAGAIRFAHTTTLTILGTLNEAFSGMIDLGPGSIFNVSQPWAIDSGAVVDVDAVQTQPFIPSTFARIEGGRLTAESGSTINVHSGRLEFDADFTAEAGAVIEVMENSTLQFDGTANVLDAEAINLSHDKTILVVNGETSIVDTAGQFDWDGNGTDAGHATTEVNEGALLKIDVDMFDAFGAGSDHLRYDGTLNVNGGTVDVRVSNTARWVMDRNLNLENTNGSIPEIIGNSMEIGNSAGVLDANVNVTGTGLSRISVDELYFRSDADVEVAAGATFNLAGVIVYFDGGEYTGSGMIAGTASKSVIGSTTIGQLGTHALNFDISGNPLLIEPGQSLTLHIAGLGSDNAVNVGMDIYDAALLDVNLPAGTEWSLDTGSIEYFGDATIDTFIAGSPVEFAAPTNVYVDGSGRTTARVDIAGTVHINDVGGQLILDGGIAADPNRISGGTINGPGELVVGDTFRGRSLVGFGDINADISGSLTSFLRAQGGTLNVNESVSGFLSVGTNDEDAVLNLATTFDTSIPTQGLRMFGGEVTGGLIRNDGGRIEGFGRITSTSINNFGTIEANGGTLVIDTVNASQLDGAAPNNGQGILHAVFGDIEVASNATTVFNGQLEVGSTRTFTMSQPNSRFRNAPASEDDDGSGDFGRIEMRGGTIVATTFEQASELTATMISTIQANNLTFENGSVTDIVPADEFDRLQLRQSSTIIEAGANFAGGGSLQNMLGSTLTLLDGAHLETIRLTNQGSVEIGSSAGAATVDSFWQISTGTWTVEIGGTAPGTEHDQLVITNVAQIDGRLEVELIDLGAGLFPPSLGDTFEILVADSVVGGFENVSLPALSAGLFWQVITQPDTLMLAVADHIAGDYNRNGQVDAADYVVWRNSQGSMIDLSADGNLDGTVDDADYSIWQANFGATADRGGLAAVPEPATLVLLSIAVAGVAGIFARVLQQAAATVRLIR